MARKSKLTPKLIEDATKLLKAGNYVVTVCEFLGIHESTWYKWMQDGEKAKTGIKKEFFESVKRAEAEAEIRLLTDLQRIAERDNKWQGIAWMLERKWPSKWGRKDTISANVEHSGRVNESHEYNVRVEQKIERVEEKYGSVIDRIVQSRIQEGITNDISDDN